MDIRKQTKLETKKRRKTQTCQVFELKIQSNQLNITQKQFLNRIFLEAKWLYNSILSSENIFKYDTKVREVTVLNKDKEFETRELKFLSAQSRQSIFDRTLTSIKSLSTKKKKGK